LNTLLVCEDYPPDAGGISVSAKRLATILSSEMNVNIVSFSRGNPVFPLTYSLRRESHSMKVYKVGPYVTGWTIPYPDELRPKVLKETNEFLLNLLFKERIDVIHGFGIQNAGSTAAYLSRCLQLPLFLSARGKDVGRDAFDGRRRGILLKKLRSANIVIAVNEWVAMLLRMNYPQIRDFVRVIPNSTEMLSEDPIYTTTKLKSHLNLDPECPVVGFVGSLREKKNPYALWKLSEQFLKPTHGKLLVVGNLDLAEYSEAGWDMKNFDGDVVKLITAGNRADVFKLISCCDWLVFPSVDDGMANGLLEAMACARPVICSETFSDVVRNGLDGIVVSPFNHEAIVSGCWTLWNNPKLRMRMGKNARERIRANFSPEVEKKNWVELYREYQRK